MTILTILRVTEILCSSRLVLLVIKKSFLEKFLDVD